MPADIPPPKLTKELLQAVLEQVSDITLILDATAAIARGFGVTRLGYSDDELIGRDVFELVHEDDRDLARRAFASISGAEATTPLELRGYQADGSFRWYDVSLAHYASEGGAAWIVVVIRDIQERRLSEAAIRDRERHYRSLVNQSPLGILIVDREFNLVEANDAYARQVGAPSRDALHGHNILTSPAIDRSGLEVISARVRNGEAISTSASYRSTFGKQVDVRVNISPLEDDSGEIVAAQMLFEDISESRQLEEQLRQSQKMEAIGRLAGGIAHDFNNNLTVILGLAELLAEGDPSPSEEQDATQEIMLSAERSAALTRQLLAVSRPGVAVLEQTDVGAVVSKLEPLLRRTLGEEIDLNCRVGPSLPAIDADPQLLEQVILNLAVNAQDAMPGGGHLSIEASTDGRGQVEIEVTDDGIGMDESTRARSIEPFFTTKQGEQGTGLGLWMVYGIVRQFHGSVEVESEPGAGSRFRLSFPASTDANNVGEPTAPRAARSRRLGGNERILILEDQAPVRRFLSATLRRRGFDVLEAEDGQEALELARKADLAIDLLLSDVRVPGLSGPETVAKLRAEKPGLRVLYISGYNDVTRDAEGRMDDGFEVLAKPFTGRRLLHRVRNLLDMPEVSA